VKFFKYWATGTAEVGTDEKPWVLRCYGGSDNSIDDALRSASAIAERAAAALRTGDERGAYQYADRALREEVLEEFAADERNYAVITRNSYGSLVLNCADALFADIDYQPPTFLESLKALFSGRRAAQAARDAPIIRRVGDIAKAHGDLGVRLYRTANGFRCLVTSATYEPRSNEAESLLRDFGSDQLYVRLCHTQECFRARLTPKFWRCGAPRPPARIPWTSDAEERAYREWEAKYERCATEFSTCALVGSFGNPRVVPAIAPVVEIHDRLACRGDLELA
jgi:hypothetical protein